ncbi:MAG: hypothetical protein PV340_03385 [Wolbachia sp.]|nr:hypothetical protein [Wolbachia sp.]MDD9336466.1 hypothetical protein [Wolbachia sp.]
MPDGDMRLINSISKVLHNSHNYLRSEEREILPDADDRSTIVCVANKGIVSFRGCNTQNDDKQSKKKKSLNQPWDNMSCVSLSNLYVRQI